MAQSLQVSLGLVLPVPRAVVLTQRAPPEPALLGGARTSAHDQTCLVAEEPTLQTQASQPPLSVAAVNLQSRVLRPLVLGC